MPCEQQAHAHQALAVLDTSLALFGCLHSSKQGYHAEAQRLREKAERTKLVVVRRIISQWLYESVSQAFYGWSSLIGQLSVNVVLCCLSARRLSLEPGVGDSRVVSCVVLRYGVRGSSLRRCGSLSSASPASLVSTFTCAAS